MRLRQAREALELTQQELGERLGFEHRSASSRMTHYEKGRHTPDYQTLERLSEELGVPVAYFFCESDVMAELVCQLDELDEEEQKKLLKKLQRLTGKS